ncbi:unnamed protein product [Strongylus vulgaris]|uniref:NADP-dependent oxidoreductase domain-containing protein n=1 Tax=Strongylus vulgaris TaxID=40348 RepID=A0A3P7JEW8_STRVU|nr:unnamed protein product [Strongylus vulgaris]
MPKSEKKLPFTAHDPKDVEDCVNLQLKALQVDYIDLYLMHCPLPLQKAKDSFDVALVNGMQVPVAINHLDTWRALEKLYDAGKLKVGYPQMVWPDGDPMSDPVVAKLAAKHKKTAAQIMLRHLHQRGMIVIPKTVKPERVKENMDIFDFSLSDEEMQELNNIKTRTRFFLWDTAMGHPFYPFSDVDQSKYKMAPLHP